MRNSHSPKRRGFTLVEMLVVIAIIGILAAILVPTVAAAIRKAKISAVAAELTQLTQAIEKYKLDQSDYPPDFTNRLAVVAHVRKAFPRNTQNVAAWLLTTPATQAPPKLDPAEALVVWLSGLTNNPRDPIGIGTSSGDPKTYFDFDKTRLKDADGDGWMEFYPKHGDGAPYVYFDGRVLDDPSNTNNVCAYAWAVYPLLGGPVNDPDRANTNIPRTITPTSTPSSDIGVARPYRSNIAINATTNPQAWPQSAPNTTEWLNQGKFQIVWAGLDNHFGWDNVTSNGLAFKQFPEPNYYADPQITQEEDSDNLGNFSEGQTIGDSVP